MEEFSNFSSGDRTTTLSRRALARTIAADIARRWESGEPITEEQALAEHPLIAAELVEELGAARSIRAALLSARRAGEIAEPLQILSQAELEAPIEIPQDELGREPRDAALRIEGYSLLELIRRGGQAEVYKAVQEATGRVVAIKVMNGGSAMLSRHRIRFDREVQILARLNHRNIVSIIDRGRSSCGSFLLIMEYVEGPELDEYCRLQLSRDEEGARGLLRLFAKIAGAVEVAHRNRIVHRDLKPSNIRIDAHGEPRLLDFGLASLTGQDSTSPARGATLSGQIVGSVPWASPEQAASLGEVGPLSDVYSLGVMLFQMLTDRFPYAIDGPLHQALVNIATAQPPVPSSVPGARRFKNDAVVDAIVLKALSKDRELRYPSAGALARDLECVAEGRKASVAPKRSRKLLYVTGVGFLLGVLSVFGWFATRPSPPPADNLPTFVNSIGMHFVHVPAGRVLLSPPIDSKSYADQAADVHDFLIGVSDVTQQQFMGLMGFNPSDRRWIGTELPVDMVALDDANAFCAKLSAKEHRQYRLPTTAEWQYAARGGNAHDLGAAELNHFAWSARNSDGNLHPVGQLWPNAFGLYDMYGGVAEWTADLQAKALHMTCGGSFLSPVEKYRFGAGTLLDADARRPDVGFRVVLSPSSR